jgi:hypothetical protein
MKLERTGINFAEILTIVFIVLKLTGFINWSWWWVLSPMLINILLFILIAIIVVMIENK